MAEMLGVQARKIGIELSVEMEGQFKLYREILLDWNERMNLTAITDPLDIQNKHFLDSLTCVLPITKSNATLIDVGTGAGFPGIPIKIARPELRVTLLDSLNKRISFLNEVVNRLGLTGIEAVHGRAEEYARKENYRESYDYAFARAVAKLNVLSEYCLPYVKTGGYFISQKSGDYEAEVAGAKEALRKLGGTVEEVMPVNIPDTDLHRTLIIIRKTQATPNVYPRSFAKIDKAPL